MKKIYRCDSRQLLNLDRQLCTVMRKGKTIESEAEKMEGSNVNLSAEFARVRQLRGSRDRQQIGRSIIAFLSGNSEPKIDRIDANNWRVFDPVSRQTLHFSTEQEIRIWLDQRYSI